MTRRASIFASVVVCLVCSMGEPTPAQVVLRGPYIQRPAPTEMTICWRTDVPTDARVDLGGTPALLTQAIVDPTLRTDHAVRITGLQPATRYFYAFGTSAVSLGGGTPDHTFRTSPPAGRRSPFRVWVTGDTGFGSQVQRDVRDAFARFNGGHALDLWLMLGDNAYLNGTDAQYQTGLFQNMYEATLRNTPLVPTIGNHDAQSANSSTQTGPYYDIFTLFANGEAGGVPSGTEAYYSYDFANAHFVCLDSANSSPAVGSPMLTWLQADLAATTREWVIAYWHHPPYTKGSHDSDVEYPLTAMRQNVVPILEAYGVDLVLCGHSHNYERSHLLDGHYGDSTTFGPQHIVQGGAGQIGNGGAYTKPTVNRLAHQGTVYAVVGCSGTVVTSSPLNHPAMVNSLAVMGSAALDINGDQLDLTFVDITGEVRDVVTLVKGGATPVDRGHVLFQPGSVWRFDDSGTDLGSSWAAPAYPDANWASGPGVFGFGEPYVATPVNPGPSPTSVTPTIYFRKTFGLPMAPALVDRLQLYVGYDDGFVAWLNGVEVARSPSMPPGPALFSTLAASHEALTYEPFDLTPYRNLLLPVGNVLAVEVHQTSATSSDLIFDAALRADAFVPYLGPCATGTIVDATGFATDVLTVNGSSGGAGRSVDAPSAGPLVVRVSSPPNSGAVPLALFAYLGTPGPTDELPLPGVGTACFMPAILAPGTPGLVFLADGFGTGAPALFTATPTPWFVSIGGGAPVGFQATMQGAVLQGGQFKLTNAVRMIVVP